MCWNTNSWLPEKWIFELCCYLLLLDRNAKLWCRQMHIDECTCCFKGMPACISNCEIFLWLVLRFYLWILSSSGHVLLLNARNLKKKAIQIAKVILFYQMFHFTLFYLKMEQCGNIEPLHKMYQMQSSSAISLTFLSLVKVNAEHKNLLPL